MNSILMSRLLKEKVTGYFKGNLYEIDDSASKPGNSTSKKLFSKE